MSRKRKAPHLTTGERGERAAVLYLLLRGYRILRRNYVCPSGEIDIVARKKGVVVFVEVRTRQAGALVDPMASIHDLKLAHFMDAARYYLVASRDPGALCRFDIITVTGPGILAARIVHYADAFRITDERPARGRDLKAWIRRQPRLRGRRVRKKKLDPETRGRGDAEKDR